MTSISATPNLVKCIKHLYTIYEKLGLTLLAIMLFWLSNFNKKVVYVKVQTVILFAIFVIL